MAEKTSTGDLVDHLAESPDVASKAAAKRIVDRMFTRIATSLQLQRDVQLTGLGVLKVQERRAPATAFGKPNPNAGRFYRQVTFRDGTTLRRRLNPDPVT